jgi:16S rRNA (guanine966-N2)-methyltransferase
MTRIVAGRVGGRRLEVPADSTRPTADRTREALFSALTAALGGFDGVRFLDLYAGSGAIGLEAWSRGAASAVLVESTPSVLAVLRRNVASLTSPADGADDAVVVVAARSEKAVSELEGPFDVVFADPPYALESELLAATLQTLVDRGAIAATGLVVVERAARSAWNWPLGIEALRDRRYGDAVLWYGRARRALDDPVPTTEVG